MEKRRAEASGSNHPPSTAFLMAQVGAHAAAAFASRLRELELAPAHAGILRIISLGAGISQQELASRLGMVPSRLVSLLDELEGLGLVERRDNPEDRRLYALHVTEKGTRAVIEIGRVARAHDDAMCAALGDKERAMLRELLTRIADEQGLIAGVHPGFARMGAGKPPPARGPRR